MAPSARTIRHIVHLLQMLRRWRARASVRLRLSRSPETPPSDVPAGHLAVCVGSANKRYVVPTSYLNHPVFRILLREVEEEYGFSSRPGPLAIPCDETVFEEILRFLGGPKSSTSFECLEDFMMQVGCGGSCRAATFQVAESKSLLSRGRSFRGL